MLMLASTETESRPLASRKLSPLRTVFPSHVASPPRSLSLSGSIGGNQISGADNYEKSKHANLWDIHAAPIITSFDGNRALSHVRSRKGCWETISHLAWLDLTNFYFLSTAANTLVTQKASSPGARPHLAHDYRIFIFLISRLLLSIIVKYFK